MSTRKNIGIWIALAAAVALHVLVLLLPLTRSVPPESNDDRIELELIAFLPDPNRVMETAPEPAPLPPSTAQQNTAPQAAAPMPIQPPPAPVELEQDRLVTLMKRDSFDGTAIILSRQFITEESVADRLFGRPTTIDQTASRQEFHFPDRPDMLAMLYTPMQDLPFEYTPGLIHFAYAPGVRGDLQRFWDVITPEFGWRTNSGTEVRCVWVLVVVGCGWK